MQGELQNIAACRYQRVLEGSNNCPEQSTGREAHAGQHKRLGATRMASALAATTRLRNAATSRRGFQPGRQRHRLLPHAKHLHPRHAQLSSREAHAGQLQEDGDYAHAFWLCVQSGQAMGNLGSLRCAQPLAQNINGLYEETVDRLESALQACCADFKPETLGKVRTCSCLGHARLTATLQA